MTQSRTSLANVAWWLFFILACAAFVTHFTLVEFGNLPEDPIQVRLSTWIEPYVHPLFLQNWNFFAPSPISEDVGVVARAQTCTTGRGCTMTPWINISEPLVQSMRRNRFTSLELIQLMLSNAAVEFHNQLEKSPAAHLKKGGKTYIKALIPESVDQIDAMIIERTSAAALKRMSPGTHYDFIQAGITDYTFPRFSKRAQAKQPENATLFAMNWHRFPREIATFVPDGGR
jgi:hypothetical protein